MDVYDEVRFDQDSQNEFFYFSIVLLLTSQ